MPGLKVSPDAVPWVEVLAPEQARLKPSTPSPMKACAALERWQPAIDSPLAVSQYAVGPSASARAGSPFVLPAQRPASPEIAESPSVTTAGVPMQGPVGGGGGREGGRGRDQHHRQQHEPALISHRCPPRERDAVPPRHCAAIERTATFT